MNVVLSCLGLIAKPASGLDQEITIMAKMTTQIESDSCLKINEMKYVRNQAIKKESHKCVADISVWHKINSTKIITQKSFVSAD